MSYCARIAEFGNVEAHWKGRGSVTDFEASGCGGGPGMFKVTICDLKRRRRVAGCVQVTSSGGDAFFIALSSRRHHELWISRPLLQALGAFSLCIP